MSFSLLNLVRCCVTFCAWLFVVSCAPQATAAHAACITGNLNIEGVAPGDCFDAQELKALLDKPVMQGETGSSADLKMTHPDEFTRQESVATCREYQAREADGWYAMSGADMAAEGWFKRVCSTLDVLAESRASRRSYLDSPSSGLSDTSLISAQCLPQAAETSRADTVALSKAGATIADLEAAGLVDVANASAQHLELEFGGQHAVYEEIARGDFDGDGTEDMLVFMAVRAKGGSMRWYEHMGLTREAPDGLLVMVFSGGV